MDSLFLLPGEAKFTKRPMTISTLFGSCVGVCLHDVKNKWGGVNHYMLPTHAGTNLSEGKYGDLAIESLIDVALVIGSSKKNLVATVIGGGNVAGHLGSLDATSTLSIGKRNIDIAREILRKHRISIIDEHVGGTHGRKISMDTATNTIQISEIQSSARSQGVAKKRSVLKQRKIRVLIVDDSAIVRKVLRKGIELSDDIEVVGEAENPYVARELILQLDPDVICLDIIMPKLDGHAFLEKLMQYKPIPTVIVSTIAKKGSKMRKLVLKAGAVGVIDKEELELFKGTDVLQEALLPQLRKAAHTFVQKRTAT